MKNWHLRPRQRLALAALFCLTSLLAALLTHPAAAAPRETTTEMSDTCSLAGGSSTIDGDLFSCCWPGWGCVHCHTEGGTITPDTCWVDCHTQACTDANARDRLDLPPKKKGPQANMPGTGTGTMAPPQTPKPKVPTVPGADTVQ